MSKVYVKLHYTINALMFPLDVCLNHQELRTPLHLWIKLRLYRVRDNIFGYIP